MRGNLHLSRFVDFVHGCVALTFNSVCVTEGWASAPIRLTAVAVTFNFTNKKNKKEKKKQPRM